MKSNVRAISTNQIGNHTDLEKTVLKYKASEFKKPVAEHTAQAFKQVEQWLGGWQGDIVIDACCGVGESTARLALQYPDAKVIGIDKSELRLSKHEHYQAKIHTSNDVQNHITVQADLNDFWRLLEGASHSAKWRIRKQYLLYPNPYPKKTQLQKRWHASPVFKTMLACGEQWELRSNWLVYLQEFQQALSIYGIQSEIKTVGDSPFTPFERKYLESGQSCWQLQTLVG